MLKNIMLIFSILFVFYNVMAQNLIESLDLVKTNNNVINIYQNENTGEIFRHFSNRIDKTVLDMKKVSRLLTENILEGIIWENGELIQFSIGEYFLATNNNFILTKTETKDSERDKTYSIKKYQIIQRSLLESEKKIQISKNHEIKLLDNGNFIISDYFENYGTEFKIYSDKMELLESYDPYLLGFSNIQFSEKNNILIATVYSTKTDRSKKMKMLFINSKSGKLQHEKEIHDNFSTDKIFALNNLFIMHGSGWLNTFSTDGKRKWDRTFDMPISIVEGDQGEYLYIVTMEKIFCLLKKNGKIIWSESISNYYKLDLGKKLESLVSIDVVPIGIYSLFSGTEIGIIIGQVKNTIGKSNLKHQIILLRLNKNGEFLGQTDLAAKSKFVKLISDNKTFKVITDNHVRTYSK